MSILIRGMEMPKNCKTCPFSDHEAWCLIPGDWRERYYCPDDERSEYCPLIELPPHGRLIDADKLASETFYGATSAPYITYRKFVNAPTVIEAEGTE